MGELGDELDRLARETGFSGVVRVDRGGGTEFERAYGLADRAFRVENTPQTRFGVASATKGLTALLVMSLVEEGRLTLDTTARSVLGDDLPLVGGHVTVEHLLAHRSGIGDYLDEDADLDLLAYLMPVPVQDLATTEDYLTVLAGHPAKFLADERFSYCNSGYVLLALIAERVGGGTFHDLVGERVCGPAAMADTGFPRSDELGGSMARGYLTDEGLRTNVLHLPVRGSGDGGAYATVGDIHRLWAALFRGEVVSRHRVDAMVRPRSEAGRPGRAYGLGFWLDTESDAVALEGSDAGVSFLSVHRPAAGITHTVVSNTTEGAWPLARHLRDTVRP